MKIFIDIGHPAHVHYFKNLIGKLVEKNHSFIITARNKEMAHYLLNHYDIDFISRGNGADGVFGKFLYLIKADFNLFKLALNERPNLFLSFGSPYCAHVATLLGKDHIVIDDTESASLGQMLYRPFSDCILTPDCFKKDLGAKQIRFPSYMELSYLHPSIFKPDKTVFNYLNIEKSQKYIIMRFVGLKAAHDIGHTGISINNKIKAVNEFKKYAKVFISSENELPSELSDYAIQLPPERMHDALAFASLFYGESGTMSSESVMLGTPAIFLNENNFGTTQEQEEKYGLISNFSESENDQLKSIEKGIEILNNLEQNNWQEKRQKLLKEKIALTSFLVWFVENYPSSKKKLFEYPEYISTFK